MVFTDKLLTCRDCQNQFVFTAGEQDFYQSRGLAHEPRRCPSCRSQRKAADGQGAPSQGRGAREMFEVLCSSCGRPAQVPFRPTGARPVYCQECFQEARAGARY